jgi:hypothetical protein
MKCLFIENVTKQNVETKNEYNKISKTVRLDNRHIRDYKIYPYAGKKSVEAPTELTPLHRANVSH